MPLHTERDLDFESLFDQDEPVGGTDRYEWTVHRCADDEVNPVDLLRHFPAEKTADGYRIPFPAGFCEDCLSRTMVDETTGAVAWLCEHSSLLVALDVREGEVAYLPWTHGRAKFERAFSLAAAEAHALATAMSPATSRKLH